jgi:hypothetical protein
MVRQFTVSAKDGGNNLALGVQLLFESASDRTQAEERRRDRQGTSEPPLWKLPNWSAEEWAPIATFTEFPSADRIIARSVHHPVSSLSAVWGSLEIGGSIVMMLDGRPLGNGAVHWIRQLPPGIAHQDLTRFVNWSAGIPGAEG